MSLEEIRRDAELAAQDIDFDVSDNGASGDDQAEEHTWQPLDIVALGAVPPEPPAIGGLFYTGRRHLVSGEAEAGKTWLLLAVAAGEIAAGRGVVWVDADNMGASAVLERLRSLGADDERIRGLFAYLRPAEPFSDAVDVQALLRGCQARLVVFDAFNPALALHHLDPLKTPDIDQFFRRVSDPFCAEGAAVVLPDHVVKKADDRGKYAYGSERKQTAVDVHLGLRTVEAFGRGRTGKAKLTVQKDRPGFLERPSPGLFVLASDADGGRCDWRIEREHDTTDEGDFRPTHLMERVCRYLYVSDGLRSRTQIEEEVVGKAIYVRQAIDVLVSEGYASEVPGDRGARLVKLERLFVEGDE